MKRMLVLIVALCLLSVQAVSLADGAAETLQGLYADAELLMATGDYAGAAVKFEALGAYSDASQMAMYCKAVSVAEDLGLYELAAATFQQLGSFRDSEQMMKYYTGRGYEASASISATDDIKSAFVTRNSLVDAKEMYEKAAETYAGLALFKDCLTRFASCKDAAGKIGIEINDRDYAAAEALYNAEKYEEAKKAFSTLKGYKDSAEWVTACDTAIKDRDYAAAEALYNAEKYEEAVKAFKALNGYKDSAAQIMQCETAIKDRDYLAAVALYEAKQYEEAIKAFKALNGYKDSVAQITACETAIKDRDYAAAIALYDAGKYEEAIAAFSALNGYKDSTVKLNDANEKLVSQRLTAMKTAKVGDTVKLGNYEQDNVTTNGKEGIEWLVLDKQGAKLLLISKYALDCQLYNKEKKNVTWETCTLRTWLNGTFLNTAFSAAEKKQIMTTTVQNPDNSTNKTKGGNATQDKVFLLSIDEAKKYFASYSVRACACTAYADLQGAYVYKGNCCWWLRSPGEYQNYAAGVHYDGDVYARGYNVDFFDIAVRPAFWIDIGY